MNLSIKKQFLCCWIEVTYRTGSLAHSRQLGSKCVTQAESSKVILKNTPTQGEAELKARVSHSTTKPHNQPKTFSFSLKYFDRITSKLASNSCSSCLNFLSSGIAPEFPERCKHERARQRLKHSLRPKLFLRRRTDAVRRLF